MTGYYVRVERAGRWQNLELDELTDAELEALHKPAHLGWPFAVALAAWIRDNVREDLLSPAKGPEVETDD
jgi:hypothetical protein